MKRIVFNTYHFINRPYILVTIYTFLPFMISNLSKYLSSEYFHINPNRHFVTLYVDNLFVYLNQTDISQLKKSRSHFFLGDSFYFNNHTFVSQTVTTTAKPIRPLYEYNNSFSHNKNFLCYLLWRQIGMDEESKFSICFSPFLSVHSCVCERVFPLIICFVL